MVWQVQEAKQRFSEVLRAAQTQGVQRVTRHGKDVAVVMSIEEYHRISGRTYDSVTDWLLSGPTIDLPDADIDQLFERDRRTDTRETPFADPRS